MATYPELAGVEELIFEFVNSGSTEAFWALREYLMDSPHYQPDSPLLEELWQAIEDQRPDIEKLAAQLWPNFLLTPNAHYLLAKYYHAKGEETGAQVEKMFFRNLLDVWQVIGDGSPERPFLVTRVDEELTLCSFLEAEISGFDCQWVNAKLHDVLLTNKGPLHFRVDEVVRRYP